MFRAAIYARVSSEKQRKDLSIPAQIHECRDFIQSQGWQFFREYAEKDAVSAFKNSAIDRHALHAMLRDAELELFDIAVVYDFARFSRHREFHILYEAKLNEQGVTLVSATEKIQDSPSGRLLKGLLTDLNQFYSENLRINVRRGQAEMLRQGKWPGIPPIGYKKIDGDCVLDPDNAPFVKMAFTDFATGSYTLNSWAEHAYEQGFKSKKGTKLKLGRWGYIFHNRFYLGILKWGELEVMGNHQALIDADIFDRVQYVIAGRTKNKNPREKMHYPLSRLLYSDDAGCRMIGHQGTSSNGEKRRYYKSVEKKKGGQGHYILADKMEKIFIDFLYEVEPIKFEDISNIDNDILLGLKVAKSVGVLYNVVEAHQQLYLAQLIVDGRGVHVSGDVIKYVELHNSFKWVGSSGNRWAKRESNKVIFDENK